MTATFRKERMGEAIRQVVSQKLSREKGIIDGGFITVSKVDVAPDYGVAKIYFSVFGENINEAEAAKAMNEHRNEFRFAISQELNLRRTPKIEFCYDKNTEYAYRVSKILAAG